MIIIQFQMLINHLFQNCEPNNDLNYVGPGVCSDMDLRNQVLFEFSFRMREKASRCIKDANLCSKFCYMLNATACFMWDAYRQMNAPKFDSKDVSCLLWKARHALWKVNK